MLTPYRLNIVARVPSQDSMEVNLADEDIYDSILQSARKIEVLSIEGDRGENMIQPRLLNVIGHIGEHVKELHLSETSVTKQEIVDIFNLMPNLEKLEIFKVDCKELKASPGIEIRLHKLKELAVEFSTGKILKVFDRLLDNVLEKLTLVDLSQLETTGNHFQNQLNIRHFDSSLYSHSNSIHLDWEQIKLKTLKLNSSDVINYQPILNRQDEMTHLSISVYQLDHSMINLICVALKSLEELKIKSRFEERFVDISQLQTLENLKELSLTKHSEETLKTLKSNSLQGLRCFYFSEESFQILSANCPNLRSLQLYRRNALFNVGKFLSHLPELEKISCDITMLTYKKDEPIRSLEHVGDTGYNMSSWNTVIEFMKRCENVKTFFSEGFMDSSMLKSLLIDVPSLKTICLGDFNPKCIEIIRNYGENLECIHLRIIDEKNYAETKKILGNQLPVMKKNKRFDSMQLSMAKREAIEICCKKVEKIWK